MPGNQMPSPVNPFEDKENYGKLLAFLYSKIKELTDRIDSLEDTFVNGLINPLIDGAKKERYNGFVGSLHDEAPELEQYKDFFNDFGDIMGSSDPYEFAAKNMWDNEKASPLVDPTQIKDAIKQLTNYLRSKYGKYLPPEVKEAVDEALDEAIGVDDNAGANMDNVKPVENGSKPEAAKGNEEDLTPVMKMKIKTMKVLPQ